MSKGNSSTDKQHNDNLAENKTSNRNKQPWLRGVQIFSSFVCVSMGWGVVVLVINLFIGEIDKGAEWIVIVLTVLYLLFLRLVRIHSYFRPPIWILIAVILIAALDVFIPDILARRSRGLNDLNQVAKISGGIDIVTFLSWLAFTIAGIVRRKADQDCDKKGSLVQQYPVNLNVVKNKECPRCAETIRLSALVCRFCGHEFDESQVAESIADIEAAHQETLAEKEEQQQRENEAALKLEEKKKWQKDFLIVLAVFLGLAILVVLGS